MEKEILFLVPGNRSIAQYINRELILWDMCDLFMFLRGCYLNGANSYNYHMNIDEYHAEHSIVFKDGSRLVLMSIATDIEKRKKYDKS